jgi:DNA polymerase-3 subunit epsilon
VSWWDGRMVAFDVETTSPDPEVARIVQAAVAVVGGGLATERFEVLIDPGVDIPLQATEVHGISTVMAQANGVEPEQGLEALLDFLEEHWGGSGEHRPLVAFNARYDCTVLDRELSRHGLGFFCGNVLGVVDPLVIDKHLDRYRKGSRKLAAICAHRGAVLDQAHDAASDAISAARLAWSLGAKGKVIRRVRDEGERLELQRLQAEWEAVRGDLHELHRAQEGWARDQAIGLIEHFTRKGQHEDAREVSLEWPVRLVPAAPRPPAAQVEMSMGQMSMEEAFGDG